jgi:hypothetical protein
MKLGEWTGNIKVEDGLVFKNCLLFPLRVEKETDLNLRTIDELVNEKRIKIEELKNPTISSVRIRNLSEEPVFLLDGEILAEALQTRVTNTSLIIDGMQDVVVPVSCVEEGRWSGKSEFTASGMCSTISLRKELMRSLIKGKSKKFESNQSRIWSAVNATLLSTGITSPTSSLYDVYKTYESRGFLPEEEEIAPILDASGVICAVNGKIAVMDVFPPRKLFRKVAKKLIAGYVVEALSSKKGNMDVKMSEIEAFVEYIMNASVEKVESPTKNSFELRFSNEKAFGRAVVYKNSAVHISSFPN